MGDTSFSCTGRNLYYKGDNRGNAVCSIMVEGERCSVKGFTDTDDIIDYSLVSHGYEKEGCDPLVGQIAPHLDAGGSDKKRYFVKAKLELRKEAAYLMCHIDGFRTSYATLSPDEVRKVLRGEEAETELGNTVQRLTSFGDGSVAHHDR